MVWFIAAFAVLLLPLRWILAAVLAAVVHELGHYAALRICGVTVHGLKISAEGTFMNVGQMDRFQTMICTLAGPIAGLSLLLISRWLPRTALCAFVHSMYNLLPIYPLDGGRFLRAVGLKPDVCRWVERICLFLILSAGVYGCVCLNMGVFPVFLSLFTLRRALAGKGLEIRRSFRYNKQRIYK